MFLALQKADQTTQTVWARATAEEVDKTNEILDYETAKPAFQAWSQRFSDATLGKSLGNVRAMHSPRHLAGKIQEIVYNDDSKSVDVMVKILDPVDWIKVTEGGYTGLSIGGGYAKKWPCPLNKGKGVIRYTPRIAEISLVDSPCLPSATFLDLQKADGTMEKIALVGHARTFAQLLPPPTFSDLQKGVIGTAAKTTARFARAYAKTGKSVIANSPVGRAASRVAAHPRVAPAVQEAKHVGWAGALAPAHALGRVAGAAIGPKTAKYAGHAGLAADYVPDVYGAGKLTGVIPDSGDDKPKLKKGLGTQMSMLGAAVNPFDSVAARNKRVGDATRAKHASMRAGRSFDATGKINPAGMQMPNYMQKSDLSAAIDARMEKWVAPLAGALAGGFVAGNAARLAAVPVFRRLAAKHMDAVETAARHEFKNTTANEALARHTKKMATAGVGLAGGLAAAQVAGGVAGWKGVRHLQAKSKARRIRDGERNPRMPAHMKKSELGQLIEGRMEKANWGAIGERLAGAAGSVRHADWGGVGTNIASEARRGAAGVKAAAGSAATKVKTGAANLADRAAPHLEAAADRAAPHVQAGIKAVKTGAAAVAHPYRVAEERIADRATTRSFDFTRGKSTPDRVRIARQTGKIARWGTRGVAAAAGLGAVGAALHASKPDPNKTRMPLHMQKGEAEAFLDQLELGKGVKTKVAVGAGLGFLGTGGSPVGAVLGGVAGYGVHHLANRGAKDAKESGTEAEHGQKTAAESGPKRGGASIRLYVKNRGNLSHQGSDMEEHEGKPFNRDYDRLGHRPAGNHAASALSESQHHQRIEAAKARWLHEGHHDLDQHFNDKHALASRAILGRDNKTAAVEQERHNTWSSVADAQHAYDKVRAHAPAEAGVMMEVPHQAGLLYNPEAVGSEHFNAKGEPHRPVLLLHPAEADDWIAKHGKDAKAVTKMAPRGVVANLRDLGEICVLPSGIFVQLAAP